MDLISADFSIDFQFFRFFSRFPIFQILRLISDQSIFRDRDLSPSPISQKSHMLTHTPLLEPLTETTKRIFVRTPKQLFLLFDRNDETIFRSKPRNALSIETTKRSFDRNHEKKFRSKHRKKDFDRKKSSRSIDRNDRTIEISF